MNFIKNIFDGKTGKENSEVHEQFQKFGKGEFKDKALISAKKRSGKYLGFKLFGRKLHYARRVW